MKSRRGFSRLTDCEQETNDRLEQIILADRLEPIILNRVKLVEHSAKLSVVVVGIETRATAVHIDGLALAGLEDGGWNQKCDYLLVLRYDATYCVVFVELKKTLTEEEKPLEQLRHSLPFLEYLRSLCCIHFEDGAPPDVAVRFAVIGERGQLRLDKQAVKARRGQAVWTKSHRGISVSAFLGPTVPLAALVGV